MVGTKQKGVLTSTVKNVAVRDKGNRKSLGSHVSLVTGESPAAATTGR